MPTNLYAYTSVLTNYFMQKPYGQYHGMNGLGSTSAVVPTSYIYSIGNTYNNMAWYGAGSVAATGGAIMYGGFCGGADCNLRNLPDPWGVHTLTPIITPGDLGTDEIYAAIGAKGTAQLFFEFI